jgi:AcrR family transcriptional regulator
VNLGKHINQPNGLQEKERYSGPVEEQQPTPYKSPRQRRSRESLERLLEAAEEQIRLHGVEALTISGVVNSIGLSVGAFYARFPDKTALLHAVQDRFHNRLEPMIREQMVAEAGPCRTLAEAVDAAVDVFIRNVVGERELSRGFMSLSVADPVLRARGELVNRQRREALSEVLLTHKDEIGHADPQLAVNVAYGMYAAVVRGRLMFGADHELYYGMDNATLYRELKRALTLYLKGGRDCMA